MRMTARRRWIVLWVTGVLSGGCGGSGGGSDNAGNAPPAPTPPPPPPPPASVAGTWNPEYTDAAPEGSASMLADCSGDLAGDEGSAALADGLSCESEDPVRVSQAGGDFQIEAMACTGSSDTQASGEGTVTGDELAGAFTITAPDETQVVEFTGRVLDPRIELSATRIELSGARNGACEITPPTTSVVVLSQ